ncbi:two-component sensor histidine kinase [Sphaerisporangium album]|uniref:histidine kinase n=1 Tax=Sphaerisporangium album TaxID=509200 RepID=A0A367F275_9ACTN|nr:two-component sensor histidine kinase [Sphaerisporangium album]
MRGLVAPLVSGTTYRRAVHLLLGAVLLLPYVLLGVAFAGMFAVPGAPYGLLVLVLALVAVIGLVPPFLRGTRALEIAAARSLLGVALPDPPVTAEPGRAGRETRLRAALWFAVHLVAGGLVGLLLLIPLVMGLAFAGESLGIVSGALDGMWLGPLDRHGSLWLGLLGVLMPVGVLYAVAGLGGLAAVMAPVLLGPSSSERIAALEARAARLAERNRLARELHDSIGHALTVTTLQAAAARELLRTDPDFAGRALAAIEETGRAAAEDLDRVLGMLREPDPAEAPAFAGDRMAGIADGGTFGIIGDGTAGFADGGVRPVGGSSEDGAPHHGLADLGRLVEHSRGTGVEVRAQVVGPVAELSAPVSREGYRIIQESLTNVLRHAGPVPVAVRVAADARTLAIDVTNPVTGSLVRREGGRGLAGMRERVILLGGSMSAGPDGGRWKVSVRLPVERPR